MTTAKNIHSPLQAAINQWHGSPTPELAVQLGKIVIRPRVVWGSVIKHQRFGDTGTAFTTAEENMAGSIILGFFQQCPFIRWNYRLLIQIANRT
jgi:hypothetical protein